MKQFFIILKLTFKVFRCLKCVYRYKCPCSVFTQFEAENFEIKIIPVDKEK